MQGKRRSLSQGGPRWSSCIVFTVIIVIIIIFKVINLKMWLTFDIMTISKLESNAFIIVTVITDTIVSKMTNAGRGRRYADFWFQWIDSLQLQGGHSPTSSPPTSPTLSPLSSLPSSPPSSPLTSPYPDHMCYPDCVGVKSAKLCTKFHVCYIGQVSIEMVLIIGGH